MTVFFSSLLPSLCSGEFLVAGIDGCCFFWLSCCGYQSSSRLLAKPIPSLAVLSTYTNSKCSHLVNN